MKKLLGALIVGASLFGLTNAADAQYGKYYGYYGCCHRVAYAPCGCKHRCWVRGHRVHYRHYGYGRMRY